LSQKVTGKARLRQIVWRDGLFIFWCIVDKQKGGFTLPFVLSR